MKRRSRRADLQPLPEHGTSRRTRPEAIDLSAEFHGHVRDFVSDQDRHWFEANPGEEILHRPAFDHELCDGRLVPSCVRLFDLPPAEAGFNWEIWVRVRRLAPGIRAKEPYAVLVPMEE